jgi:UDPglucose--hexose-1-phosphate uridylyltransferase
MTRAIQLVTSLQLLPFDGGIQYDPKCYSIQEMNVPKVRELRCHEQTMVFVSDYAAVLPPPNPIGPVAPHPILTTQPVDGQCDVLVFHPGHDLTLVRLPSVDAARIMDEWIAAYKCRETREGIKYVHL